MPAISHDQIVRGTHAKESQTTTLWEFRSVDEDYIFMVGADAKAHPSDVIVQTRIMSREVFLTTTWETVD